MILRPYQSTGLEELWAWLRKHHTGNPIVEASVGAGKSVMIAAVAQRCELEAPGTRVLVLVHQRELLEQNLQKLKAIWPQADVGVVSAAMGRKQLGHQITYATIGSIHKMAHKLGRVDLIMADEAHLINPKEAGMWRGFLKDLRLTCPNARVIGWTGTPFRGNGIWLTAGEEALFTHVATRVTMTSLLEQGYLAPLVPAKTTARIATDGVRTSGDDYVVHELAKVTDTDALVAATCGEIVVLGADRKRWLVFAVTLEHAGHVRDALRDRGVAAEVVSGDTPKAERDKLFSSYRKGGFRCLVNVGVATTGFDVPEVDFIALLRATKSPVLYVQIGGRGMRCVGQGIAESIANGKANCIAEGQLVLTHMGPVPIESVTKEHLVWDGCEFVRHDGAVCKGEQIVISYAGLTATTDHMVWTAGGWASFGDCAQRGIAISVGADGGQAVREIDRNFRGGDDHQGQQVHGGHVRGLRELWASACRELEGALRWVSGLCQTAVRSGVASQAVRGCFTALQQPEQQAVLGLRWTWPGVWFPVPNRHGCLDPGQPRSGAQYGDRQDRQRSRLHAGEHPMVNAGTEPSAHAEDPGVARDACVQAAEPRSQVRGRHACAHVGSWYDTGPGRGPMASAVVQTKRRVWDILNAGPLHRFTCEGLIVSNCLWADFTSTTVDLGPIDKVEGRMPAPRGGGEAPFKLCPSCGSQNAAGASVCSSCGHEFPPPERVKHTDGTNGAQVLSTGAPMLREVGVRSAHYSVHTKDGSPSTMRVEYMDGIKVLAREWVCFDHQGYARRKAEAWWAQRSSWPPPPDVASAVAYAAGGGLRLPTQLSISTAGKYPEIVGVRFEKEMA